MSEKNKSKCTYLFRTVVCTELPGLTSSLFLLGKNWEMNVELEDWRASYKKKIASNKDKDPEYQ